MMLGEPVGQLPSGSCVRFRIPARARGSVAQPECAREIDDAHACIDQPRRELGGRRVGQREEHHIGVAGERVAHRAA